MSMISIVSLLHDWSDLPSDIRKRRIVQAFEDGNRSSLLRVIQQDRILSRDSVHQPIRKGKHAC